ncbi:hypothetical protein SE15_04785 [Thermanaerothrix daxensis]|uniref:Methicillin resistance protein n=1 Tax=Thermanaerothrix daxensis TaxID=869279 RepID=A0A0P6XP35_9CHLR|nr:peptidoglycan bridge formation glycyltransferase FemA/FemB family protein [Thermanaerothrix daxensis]KPL84430.1 hypothetical protein SE15_04785 [Thermanaerothrix daxensis]
MPQLNYAEWEAFLRDHPEAHLLQTPMWGMFKAEFGWRVAWVVTEEAGVQVLFRRLPLGLSIAYIPKGPVGRNWAALWSEVEALCRQFRAIFLKVEPDAWEPLEFDPQEQLPGFRPAEPIQPRRTIEISLEGAEEEWLERMKQKTRYNIRLAQKKGVVVRESRDLSAFYALMEMTGRRDGFGIHTSDYYERAYQKFAPGGHCVLLMAEYEGMPLAGLMAFAWGHRAWYFYGASSDQERHRMPTYLLQWEAMRWAAQRGCRVYDLWGIPDADETTLEAEFARRSEGLWGVYRFKRGFGGRVRRSVGAWDKIYQPSLYRIYRWFMRFRRRGEPG